MELTVEQNKKLVEKFPYLIPTNIWTGEVVDNYDYSYIEGVCDLPVGWHRLFLLYCKNIRPLLEKFDYIDKYRFSQIKEKYGSMRLYDNGYPTDCNVDELNRIYEHLSTYTCEDCGKPAKYETPGWITELCESCYKVSYQSQYVEDKTKNKIRRKDFTVRLIRFSTDGTINIRYDSKPYWEEYLKCRRMSDSEFVDYLLEDKYE